jgi:Kef-type K+ transport system membrane component KefB
MLAALCLSACITEWIGIHALLGAFFIGALIPSGSPLARDATRGLHVVVSFLLPIFFALTGLRTHIGSLSTASAWITCLMIVSIAFAGKLGGVWLAARFSGMQAQEALGLGVLMNARGLMELIVLNIGLDFHIISPTLFTMMVIMALVTTCATGPLLSWAGYPPRTPA